MSEETNILNDQYAVMVDNQNKLVFPTIEEFCDANKDADIVANSFSTNDGSVIITNNSITVKYLGDTITTPSSSMELTSAGLYHDGTILIMHDGHGSYTYGTTGSGLTILDYSSKPSLSLGSNDTEYSHFNLSMLQSSDSDGYLTLGKADNSSYIKFVNYSGNNINEFIDKNNSLYVESASFNLNTKSIKGWYIQKISSETVVESNKNVQYVSIVIGQWQKDYNYLLDNNHIITEEDINYAKSVSVNDVLTIFNNGHQHACMYVTEINNGVIKCKWILGAPFKLVEDTDDQFINYGVYIIGTYNKDNIVDVDQNKLTAGVIDFTATSMTLGTGNLAGGYGAIASGHDNTVAGWYTSAFGRGHVANSYASAMFGRTNTINSADFCFVAGQSNNISGSQAITSLAGYDIPNGDGNAVFGRINRCKSSIGCAIFGIANNATGSITSLVCGTQNAANGGYNLLIGQTNKIKSGNHNAVIGISNEVTGPRSFAIGQSLIGKTEQLVIGKYNVEDANAAFIIGRGINGSNRKNIFTVSKTGEVNITNENSETVTISVEYFKSLEARIAELEAKL